MGNEKKNNRAKIAFYISVTIFILILIACAIYLVKCTPLFSHGAETETAYGAESVSEPPVTETDPGTESNGTEEIETKPELPSNPVNFSKQWALNDDIYAWIYIPGTNVNYPILQSDVDDLYYLRRGVDEEYDISGVIFTQSCNKKDFTDPVTLIYGHNMSEYGTMFATLHNFENEEFFNKNEKFYIYAPGHIYTYRIVSAYRYDDRHIMNTFNFRDSAVVREYFDYVMNPTMIPQNVREGVELKDDDRLVVLSTCMEDNNYRYLVNGVLIDDQRTK
ncbi:MAG: class B sortase [Clostridia bacterium]|nr:class B sortase [Clostridia bacterium]